MAVIADDVYRIAVLSDAHLEDPGTLPEDWWVDDGAGRVEQLSDGWLAPIPAQPLAALIDNCDGRACTIRSLQLLAVMAWARQRGCTLIRFVSGAALVEGLPVYISDPLFDLPQGDVT